MLRIIAFAYMGVMLMLSPADATTVISTFDVDAEGWSVAPGGDPSSTLGYSFVGGNPGGRIILNEGGQGGSDYFFAPTKFLGDKTAYYGGTLSYDVMENIATSYFGNPVALSNGTDTLYHAISSFSPGAYASFSFTRNESSGWTYNSSGAPTSAQFIAVLSNIASIRIPGDFHFGSENVSLDNVRMITSAADTADFDADADVDGADLLIWQRGVGTLTGATRAVGNSNVAEDGDVDADDLTVWRNQFGRRRRLCPSQRPRRSVSSPRCCASVAEPRAGFLP